MKIFNAILGVYAIFNALYCILWPEESVLGIGWIVAFLLVLWGISSIAEYFFTKKNLKRFAACSAVGLGLGIVSIVVSIMAMTSDILASVLAIVVILCLSLGILVKGIVELINNRYAKGRRMTVVSGIFYMVAGIFGIASLVFLSSSVSLALGIMLIVIGVAEFSSLFGSDDAQELSEIW